MLRPALCATVLALAVVSAQARQEPPRFRVGVDAVRIDAVVTDRDGHVVSDLTANDFEVRQDGKPQTVTFAEFVPILSGAPATPSPRSSGAESAPVVAAAPAQVERENVQRTFAIVVDDLGLSLESFVFARKALHAFVDREIGPHDLVAIVRTGGSLDGLQPFTMDRRVLHTAIDAVRWHGFSRSGVEPFTPINTSTDIDPKRTSLKDPIDFESIDRFRSQLRVAGTLGALNLVTRSARDLPGRKAIVFVSEGFEIPRAGDRPMVREAVDRVIDQAARTGVVIYGLDARGLQTGGLGAADNTSSLDGAGIRTQQGARRQTLALSQDALAYLCEQTGGFAVLNTNDLGRGLGRIVKDVRDYYVIGYVPDDSTFKKVNNKTKLHDVSVKVRRPGLRVKTRKSFFGVSDPDEAPSQPTPANQLIHAAVSPFVATDIRLRATTLPAYAPESGMFVRTLLHIDARALRFVDDDGGKKTASVDVLGMAFDQDGTEVAHLSTGFAVALTSAAADDALRDGLAYTLRIPIRRAGAYQIRFAVRDRNSAAIGSTGEFVEIPDIARGQFALSGIVLRQDDAESASPASGETMVKPALALRTYAPGTRLSYAYDIYNAGGPVRSAASVWRGADNVLTVPAVTLTPPTGRVGLFAASGGIKLGEQLPSGNYVLQITATTADPARQGKPRTAVQRIAFDVR